MGALDGTSSANPDRLRWWVLLALVIAVALAPGLLVVRSWLEAPESRTDIVEQSLRFGFNDSDEADVVHCVEPGPYQFECYLEDLGKAYSCVGRVRNPTGVLDQAARLTCRSTKVVR